jgi:hypothetical protein
MPDDSKSFFQTIPGILSAAATVLTAITGLIIALNQVGLFHSSPPSATSATGPAGQPSVASGSGAGANSSDALTGMWLNTLIS